MDTRMQHMTADECKAVAELAYSIWLQEGKPSGRHFDNWLMAEAQYAAKKRDGAVPGSRGTTAPASPPLTPALGPTPGREAQSTTRRPYSPQREAMKVPEARGY